MSGAPATPATGDARQAVRSLGRRHRVEVHGGTEMLLMVLACHPEDTVGVDLASGALARVRVPWAAARAPDLAPFDVVEVHLADEPERDDLAQPEAVTAGAMPRHLGDLRGRRVRRALRQVTAPRAEHVLGFRGASAPYWEFRGFRPSLALLVPERGPVLYRHRTDRSVWARFTWAGTESRLPVEDERSVRALDAAHRERLAGKDLATALGYRPHYLLAALSAPRDGHCYKTVRALLPRS